MNFSQEQYMKLCVSWVWWDIRAIPALRSLKQENLKFEDILGYIDRPCLKKKKKHVYTHMHTLISRVIPFQGGSNY
jgi:hypothetical protein